MRATILGHMYAYDTGPVDLEKWYWNSMEDIRDKLSIKTLYCPSVISAPPTERRGRWPATGESPFFSVDNTKNEYIANCMTLS